MKQFLFTVLFTLGSLFITAQQDITSELYDSYEQYKEPSLTKRRIKHKQVQSLIQRFVDNSKFEIQN